MASGGVRPNAGRKAGTTAVAAPVTPTVRRQVVDVLMERVKHINVSPLEVMLVGMKFHFDEGQEAMKASQSTDDKEMAQDFKRTAKAELAASMSYAEKVAPYIHAKLQSVTLKGDKENPLELTLGLSSAEELRRLVRGGK